MVGIERKNENSLVTHIKRNNKIALQLKLFGQSLFDRNSFTQFSKNLIGANIELVSQERREFRMREALEPIRSSYPFILLDCPPALDLLTLNSLVAADGLLVPMQAEYFALEGISELMSTLDRVSQAFNPKLSLEGILLTMSAQLVIEACITLPLSGSKLDGAGIAADPQMADALRGAIAALLTGPSGA